MDPEAMRRIYIGLAIVALGIMLQIIALIIRIVVVFT